MNTIKPVGFQEYWRATLRNLAKYPAAPEIRPLPLRSTPYAECFSVKITSAGPYRLFAYLSIPKGEGNFPAIYYPPQYKSVLEIIPQGSSNYLRSRYVVMSLAGRGQRNSDQPYSAMFPGQFTENIGDLENYVFRNIVADGIRGLEFLFTRPEVDRKRIAVVGNDVALMTTALLDGSPYVVCTPSLFVDSISRSGKSNSYPMEEINDYLNLFPSKKNSVEETLSYFDLRWFAPMVTGKTLIMAGPRGTLLDAEALGDVASGFAGDYTIYESVNSSYKDGLYSENWLSEAFGFGNSILPAHWV